MSVEIPPTARSRAPMRRRRAARFAAAAALVVLAVLAVGAGAAVRSMPVITVEPADQTVAAGSVVTFTAAATGEPEPVPQWNLSTDGGASFHAIPGANAPTLSFTATLADDGKLYIASFANDDGVVASRAATLHVRAAPLKADLGVTQSASPATVVQGETTTLRAVVENGGPAPATGVTLDETFGAGLTVSSASASQGSCSGSGPVACNLGSLAAGASATVTIVVSATATGALTATAKAAAGEPDPNGTNDSASTPITATGAQPPLEPPPPPNLPPPERGSLVNAQPVTGTVLVDGAPLTSPDQLRVGAVVDVTHGSIELVTAKDIAVFFGGSFKLVQPRDPAQPTDLVLQGGKVACPTKKGKRAPAAAPLPKVVRELWGAGKGNFRTVGRYSSASVRGTIWVTQERCDGTFTRVRRGVVAVRDLVRGKTIVLRAGQTYLARPR